MGDKEGLLKLHKDLQSQKFIAAKETLDANSSMLLSRADMKGARGVAYMGEATALILLLQYGAFELFKQQWEKLGAERVDRKKAVELLQHDVRAHLYDGQACDKDFPNKEESRKIIGYLYKELSTEEKKEMQLAVFAIAVEDYKTLGQLVDNKEIDYDAQICERRSTILRLLAFHAHVGNLYKQHDAMKLARKMIKKLSTAEKLKELSHKGLKEVANSCKAFMPYLNFDQNIELYKYFSEHAPLQATANNEVISFFTSTIMALGTLEVEAVYDLAILQSVFLPKTTDLDKDVLKAVDTVAEGASSHLYDFYSKIPDLVEALLRDVPERSKFDKKTKVAEKLKAVKDLYGLDGLSTVLDQLKRGDVGGVEAYLDTITKTKVAEKLKAVKDLYGLDGLSTVLDQLKRGDVGGVEAYLDTITSNDLVKVYLSSCVEINKHTAPRCAVQQQYLQKCRSVIFCKKEERDVLSDELILFAEKNLADFYLDMAQKFCAIIVIIFTGKWSGEAVGDYMKALKTEPVTTFVAKVKQQAEPDAHTK